MDIDEIERDGNKEQMPVMVGDVFSDGVKPPWGCLWCAVWRHNVRALRDCKQTAVVVHQCAPNTKLQNGEKWGSNDHVEKGSHMGLGDAKRGEVAWMREQNIPFVSFTVDQYTELVKLAKAKRGDYTELVELAKAKRGDYTEPVKLARGRYSFASSAQ